MVIFFCVMPALKQAPHLSCRFFSDINRLIRPIWLVLLTFNGPITKLAVTRCFVVKGHEVLTVGEDQTTETSYNIEFCTESLYGPSLLRFCDTALRMAADLV